MEWYILSFLAARSWDGWKSNVQWGFLCCDASMLFCCCWIQALSCLVLSSSPCVIHQLGSRITCAFSSCEVWDLIAWGWFKHPERWEQECVVLELPCCSTGFSQRARVVFMDLMGAVLEALGFAGQEKSVQPLAQWKELLAPCAWGFFPTQREVALPYECFISVTNWQKPPKILNQSICK